MLRQTPACCPAQMCVERCRNAAIQHWSGLQEADTTDQQQQQRRTNPPGPCCLASARQLLPQLSCLACGCFRCFHPTTKAEAWSSCTNNPAPGNPTPGCEATHQLLQSPDRSTLERSRHLQRLPRNDGGPTVDDGVPGRRITAAAVSFRVCNQKEMGLSAFAEGLVSCRVHCNTTPSFLWLCPNPWPGSPHFRVYHTVDITLTAIGSQQSPTDANLSFSGNPAQPSAGCS